MASAVTFPATQHHRRLTGTKLYCLVTEAHVCEQLAWGRYPAVSWCGVEPAPLSDLRRYFAAIHSYSVKMVADRCRLAAYHNKHWWHAI